MYIYIHIYICIYTHVTTGTASHQSSSGNISTQWLITKLWEAKS